MSILLGIIAINLLNIAGSLKENAKLLHLMADALMKFETLNEDQISTVMQGKMPKNAPPKKKPPTKKSSSKKPLNKENLESI